MKKKLLVIAAIALIFLCCTTVVSIYIFQRFIPFVEVEGHSMTPTLQNGEIWVLDRSYKIDRDDIIVFHKPGKPDYIKRVIAMPGETIKIEDSRLYINGNPYSSEFNDNKVHEGDFIIEGQSFIIPPNSYYVMGDNRENSFDSRYKSVGFIKDSEIEGELLFRVFPFQQNF